jgi:WD40 repeat protein
VPMRYDVFISYSHTGDDLLSERVQAGLQRFAKPWWRRRALNVFRDRTGLSANPGLWSSIADAIDDSQYFLMLASPEAAASPWVAREVAQWRAKRGSDNLLILLTDGDIAWNDNTNDFDWRATTALSAAAFAGCFLEEPRHVDMRWARSEVQLDLTDGRFRDQIAELAAPAHGIAKDELAGADVRQHRRTLRHAFAAGVALVLLTLASIATSAYAVNAAAAARSSAARARTEQHRADTQAQLASKESEAATKASLLADQRRNDANRQRALAVARQREAQLSAVEAVQQRGLADARARDVAAANGKLVTVNGQLVNQQTQTESQRAAAVANALIADQQRGLAQARAGALSTANGKLATANGNLSTANGNLATANGNLVTVNGKLVSQQQATQDQRLAGVARQLTLGSQASLADHAIDRGLLLAAEATKFAARSGGLIGDVPLRDTLVAALQRNPRLVGTLRGLGGPIADVAVAPDDSRAAAVSLDDRVGVWQLRHRQLMSTFPVPTGADRVRFLDPNTLLVGSGDQQGPGVFTGDQEIDAYRTADGGTTWMHAWTWHTSTFWGASAIATTPGLVVAGAGDPIMSDQRPSPVEVLDANGRRIRLITLSDPVERIAFAPSGTTYATAGLGFDPADPFAQTMRVFVHVFTAPATEIASFGFDPSMTPPTSLVSPGIADLGFSSDGRQVNVLGRGFAVPLSRWDIATGTEVPFFAEPWSGTVPGTPIGLSRNLDGIVQRDATDPNLAEVGHVSTGGSIKLDAPIVAQQSVNFGPIADLLRPPAFTSDGQSFLLSAEDGTVPIFALTDAPNSHYAQTRTYGPSGFSICNPVISPDGRILATGEMAGFDRHVIPGTLRFTTLDGSRGPVTISLRTGGCPGAFSDNGAEMAVEHDLDGSVDVYDTSTGKSRLHLNPQQFCNTCLGALAFSGSLDDGRIAEAYNNGELWTWDLRSGKTVAIHHLRIAGQDLALKLALSTSGSRLAVTTFASTTHKVTVHVLDATANGWSERWRLPVQANAFGFAEAMSADGTEIAIGDGSHLTMYDLDRKRVVWTTDAMDGGVWFGTDGTLFTTRSVAGCFANPGSCPIDAILARARQTGTIQFTIDAISAARNSRTPSSLVFTGSHLLTAAAEVAEGNILPSAIVTDWPLAIPDLVAAACTEAGRNLTISEWTQYVGTFDAYEKTCANLP